MTTKIIAISAVLAAVAMLAGVVATTPIYADESETEKESETKQRATGSGWTDIDQCADNLIDSQQGPSGISFSGGECIDNDTPTP
jgi:hypothetical protein